MAEAASLSVISYFLPIFAFLLVFFIIFFILKATGAFGESGLVSFIIAFILASFFILEASLVEWVQIGGAWMAVFVFVVFFILVVVGFIPGLDFKKFFVSKGNWFAWVLLGLVVGFFIISSAYVFDWAVNWGVIRGWVDTQWFGMVLLLAIAGVVSWRITRG